MKITVEERATQIRYSNYGFAIARDLNRVFAPLPALAVRAIIHKHIFAFSPVAIPLAPG